MRYLLTPQAKRQLLAWHKQKHHVRSLRQLSQSYGLPKSTLEKWFYAADRYIPETFVPPSLTQNVIDTQPDNWGQCKGGKTTIKALISKYGIQELRKRQINGGKARARQRETTQPQFSVDIDSPSFLEWYGALLGDGWLSALSYTRNTTLKKLWWVGISGHAILDRPYLEHLARIATTLFNRSVITKFKKNTNAMEIVFSHKMLVLFMNHTMHFPIGLKKDLHLPNSTTTDWTKLKFVIRGIFDTDGSFYLDKTPSGNPYPCICIHMKAPRLLSQLSTALIRQGYKAALRDNKITLKGSIQVNHWMDDIGSSNPKHVQKYTAWKNSVPVA